MITKGEWFVNTDDDGDVRIKAGNGDVAIILGNEDDYEANAQLIASAPDLYEALKETREWLSEEYPTCEPLLTINKALSKAEGK